MTAAREITQLPVSEIKVYENNSRMHTPEQIKQIAASITEFGFTNPVLVDGDNVLIAGHARLEAAKSIDLTNVPAIKLSDLTDAQKRAYVIADNKLALNAQWNLNLLEIELSALDELGYDLNVTGFNEAELASLMVDPELKQASTEWEGMPEFVQDNNESYKRLIVHFANEEDLQEFANLIGQELNVKTKYIWHPKMEIEETAHLAMVGDEEPADA